MKRWVWAVAAAVLAVAGVTYWLWPTSADVVVITAINADGTVEWVDGDIKPAEENNTNVRQRDEDKHVAKLADDVVITTAQGCGSPTEIRLSWDGLGAVPCTREEFLGLPSPPYAPRLEFDHAGEITEIAGRYHP